MMIVRISMMIIVMITSGGLIILVKRFSLIIMEQHTLLEHEETILYTKRKVD